MLDGAQKRNRDKTVRMREPSSAAIAILDQSGLGRPLERSHWRFLESQSG